MMSQLYFQIQTVTLGVSTQVMYLQRWHDYSLKEKPNPTLFVV